MRPWFKLRSRFMSDVFSTGVTQFLVYVLMALLLRVMASWLGTEEMGVYLVIRRFVGIAAALSLFELHVSLVRYVALRPAEARSYLGWGVLLTTLSSIVLVLIVWLGGGRIASLVLGKSDLQSLMLPAILFLAGNVSFTVLYAYLRGWQRMAHANSLQLVYNSIVLVIAFGLSLISAGSLDVLVVYLCLGGLVPLVLVSFLLLRERFQITLEGRRFKELMSFGLPRLPSSFLLNATFSIPLFIAASRGSFRSAALLGIGLDLVRLLEPAAMPISIILLPKIVELVRTGNREKLETASLNAISAAVYLAMFVSLTAPGLSPEIIRIWFGTKYAIAVPVSQIVLVGTGSYLAYVILRGLLDALSVRPIVTLLTTLSAAGVAVGSFFARDEAGLAYGLVAGFLCLGVGAVAASMYLSKAALERRTCVGLGLTLGLGLLVCWIDREVISFSLWPSLLMKLSTRAMSGVVLAFCLWHLHVPWFIELVRRLPFSEHLGSSVE